MDTAPPSDLVGLNIGGCKFATTKTTLRSCGPNFFTRLLDGSISSTKDAVGNFFVDRNGKAFSPLLDFMRTRQLIIPPTLSLASVLLEADFYSIDLSRAFCGTIHDGADSSWQLILFLTPSGLYANGRDVLFVEHHPQHIYQVILTGMVVLDDTKNKVIREFWKQVCEIKKGVIQCGSCEIEEGENGDLVVRATKQYSNSLLLPFVSASRNGVPDLKPKTWWEGDKFIDGDYVMLMYMRLDDHDESEDARDDESDVTATYAVSIRVGKSVVGPYDVRILCDRFFIVDGQDDAFWVYMQGSDRMATYNQFYAEKRPGAKFARGDFQHFTKGWMRFIPQPQE